MTTNKSRGQLDYESDLARRPLYHDGRRRKTWNQLGEVERWSWDRPSVSTLVHHETAYGRTTTLSFAIKCF